MIIYRQKQYNTDKDKDKDYLSLKDLAIPTLSTAGAGAAAHILDEKLEGKFYDHFKRKLDKEIPITEEERKKLSDYLKKYAKDNWGDNLSISHVDPKFVDQIGYLGYHLEKNPLSKLTGTTLSPKELNAIIEKNPELLKERSIIPMLGKYTTTIPDFIFARERDVETTAHEIGHHEISHAKSKSARDLLEKVSQNALGLFEAADDTKVLHKVKNIAVPLGSTLTSGYYVDEDDNDKIKFNKNSLIAPGAVMVGDSAVPIFEHGASRRGVDIIKNSGILKDEKKLNSIKNDLFGHNDTYRRSNLASNLITTAAATGLGLGVSRLNAELLKNKKLKENEKGKEEREKYIILNPQRYVIPRKDRYNGLTEEEKKRYKKAEAIDTTAAVSDILGLYGTGIGIHNIRSIKELGKKANMPELIEKANKKTKNLLIPVSMLAAGIGGHTYANKLIKREDKNNNNTVKK